MECSGAGTDNAAEGARRLFEAGATSLFVCGFGGGFSPLAPGALLVGERVIDCTGVPIKTYEPDPTLLQCARRAFCNTEHVYFGALATGNRVLLNQQEKQNFLERWAFSPQEKPLGVDMESAGAAQVAISLHRPWLAVRAITDGESDAMPFDFNAMADAKGNIPLPFLLTALLRRPQQLLPLLRLGLRANYAAKRLSLSLQNLLTELGGGY